MTTRSITLEEIEEIISSVELEHPLELVSEYTTEKLKKSYRHVLSMNSVPNDFYVEKFKDTVMNDIEKAVAIDGTGVGVNAACFILSRISQTQFDSKRSSGISSGGPEQDITDILTSKDVPAGNAYICYPDYKYMRDNEIPYSAISCHKLAKSVTLLKISNLIDKYTFDDAHTLGISDSLVHRLQASAFDYPESILRHDNRYLRIYLKRAIMSLYSLTGIDIKNAIQELIAKTIGEGKKCYYFTSSLEDGYFDICVSLSQQRENDSSENKLINRCQLNSILFHIYQTMSSEKSIYVSGIVGIESSSIAKSSILPALEFFKYKKYTEIVIDYNRRCMDGINIISICGLLQNVNESLSIEVYSFFKRKNVMIDLKEFWDNYDIYNASLNKYVSNEQLSSLKIYHDKNIDLVAIINREVKEYKEQAKKDKTKEDYSVVYQIRAYNPSGNQYVPMLINVDERFDSRRSYPISVIDFNKKFGIRSTQDYMTISILNICSDLDIRHAMVVSSVLTHTGTVLKLGISMGNNKQNANVATAAVPARTLHIMAKYAASEGFQVNQTILGNYITGDKLEIGASHPKSKDSTPKFDIYGRIIMYGFNEDGVVENNYQPFSNYSASQESENVIQNNGVVLSDISIGKMLLGLSVTINF